METCNNSITFLALCIPLKNNLCQVYSHKSDFFRNPLFRWICNVNSCFFLIWTNKFKIFSLNWFLVTTLYCKNLTLAKIASLHRSQFEIYMCKWKNSKFIWILTREGYHIVKVWENDSCGLISWPFLTIPWTHCIFWLLTDSRMYLWYMIREGQQLVAHHRKT